MVDNRPGFCSLDSSFPHPIVTMNNAPRHCHMSPDAESPPLGIIAITCVSGALHCYLHFTDTCTLGADVGMWVLTTLVFLTIAYFNSIQSPLTIRNSRDYYICLLWLGEQNCKMVMGIGLLVLWGTDYVSCERPYRHCVPWFYVPRLWEPWWKTTSIILLGVRSFLEPYGCIF